MEAQDWAIAQELQRRIIVHDMVRERVLAERLAAAEGPGMFPSYQPRVPDMEPEAGPEPESEAWKEFREKWNKLSESAKLKMREWWSKLRPAPTAATPAGAQQRYSALRSSARAGPPAADDDDEQVAFDSSLSRRLKPIPAAEMEVFAATTAAPPAAATTTTAAAAAPAMPTAIPAPSAAPADSKKKKDD